MAKHRWLTWLEEEQIDWIKKIADEAETSGATVVREIVAREMKNTTSALRGDLVQAKLRMRLQKLNDAKAKIESEWQDLTKKLKSDRTLVNV